MDNQNQPPEQQPLAQPTQQVPPPTSPKSKLPIFIIAFVILIIIGGGVYFLGVKNINQQKQANVTPPSSRTALQPSPTVPASETVSWKTYKDDKYNFSFQYPAYLYETMNISSYSYNGSAISSVLPYSSGPEKEDDIKIEIFTIDKLPSESTESYIEKNVLTHEAEDTNMDGKKGPPIKITPTVKKNMVIGGKDATWLEGVGFESVAHTEVFIKYSDSKLVWIKIFDGTMGKEKQNTKQYEQNKTLINQILSTFRFD